MVWEAEKWGGLEHVLTQSTIDTNTIIKKLIQSIMPSNVDDRTKIAIILRTLEDELRKASIHDWMLEVLEVYEQLLILRSKPVTTFFQDAYCAIAVDCTLRYLHSTASRPNYIHAIKTIWKDRIYNIQMSWESELFSDELQNWKNQILDSLLDPRIFKKLASVPFTRKDALQKLQLFLAQAWENLAPTNNLDVTVNYLRLQVALIKGKSINTVDAERMDATASCSKINSMPVDEVPKTGESLQSSSAELENQEMEDMNQEAQLENNSSDAHVPISQACKRINNNKANHKKTTSAHQSDVHHPSLMEPNRTARTHEWDDSIGLQGGTSDTSKISLPSPKRREFPPLEKYKLRRKKRTWSEMEEDNLRAGVKRFGSDWKKMVDTFTFERRTPVDLKDKWRNMLRSGKAQE